MKILYITYDGIHDSVGQSQVIPYLCGLVKKEMEIFLISFEKKTRIQEKTTFFSCDILLANGGMHWSPLIYHKNPAIPATLFDILHGILKGWVLVKRNKITTIHARGYIAGLIAYFLKILNNVDFIFDMRGFWPEEKVDAGDWKERGFLYRIFKYLEKKMLLQADEIIVLTEAARGILTHIYNLNKISVIPCCVNLETFSIAVKDSFNLSLPKDRLLISYIGSIGSFYDFKGMVKFFQVFKRKTPQSYFLILSNGNKKYIYQILRKFNIDSDDYLLTSVPHNQVPLYMRHTAFSLIFYRRFLSGSGCCPIKFAASLACGVPVIISPGIGDCDRIVQQERVGAVLKGQSVEFYTQAIQDIEDLLQEGREVSERCRNTAKKYFSLEDGIEKYFSIYRKTDGTIK